MQSDAELLRAYADQGSESAFTELVQRHVGLVYFAALRQLGDAQLAEDVAQSVFTDLARKAGSLSRRPLVANWLHTSTRFAAIKVLRTEQRRRKREREAEIMNTLLRDENTAHDWDRLRPMIDEAIAELNERDREAVLLRFFEGRRFADIGTALAVSEDAARVRVERALAKLQTLLVRRGVTSTVVALGVALGHPATAAAPAALATSVAGTALAGAASAGGLMAAVNTLFFMSTTKVTASIAVAVAVLAVAMGIADRRGTRAEAAALAAAHREVFTLAQRVDAARQRAAQVAPPPTSGGVTRTAAPHAALATEVEVNGPFGPEKPGSRARGRALMAAYPEIQRLVIEEKRAFFAPRYRKLYEELGLTDAQIEAFEMIMIAGVSSTFGAGENTVTLDAAPAISDAEKKRRLRELLDDRGYQRFQAYQSSPQDRRVVNLASSLCFTDTPLTQEQATRFQRVLIANAPAYLHQPPAGYWKAVQAQAAEFLSEPQIAAVKALQAEDEFTYARIQNQKLRNPPPVTPSS